MLSPKTVHVDLNLIIVFGLPCFIIFAGLEVALSIIPWIITSLAVIAMVVCIVGATIPAAKFSINGKKTPSLQLPQSRLERPATWLLGLSFLILAFLGKPLVLCLGVPLAFFIFDKKAALTWDEYVSNTFQKATLQALAIATLTLFLSHFFQITLLEQIIVLVSVFFFSLQIYFWRWRASANQGADA
jgi:hypothetical protein